MSGCPDCRIAKVNKMLTSTAHRDQLMGVIQFLPGALMPVVEKTGNTELKKSLEALAGMAGTYRSTTRLTSLFSMLTKGAPPKTDGTPESVTNLLSWVFTAIFLPMENIAVYAGNGVMARDVSAERKAEYGPRCVYFWFYSLVFEQLTYILKLAKLKKKPDSAEKEQEVQGILKKFLQAFLWFIMAWGSMPQQGTIKLLQNPEASFLKPLHSLVELTTVNGITLGPWTKAMCGMIPTVMTISDICKTL
eukprot:TRINITY_DN27019_c0_g1_i1.p1 TRINITY_DN27019_c0_g1~~TRINITY_DN27019_c0_g1_i1.p1  ORF type:complete len:248 (+),score=54.62 TRINITY_DN27019_c0_g1_i1:50-793(+)